MALKNEETTPLGKRLFELMEEKGFRSPKELAQELYDSNRIQVKSRKDDNPEYDNRLSAIGSIEKKILRHIKSGKISDSSGDYLPAYCNIFNCSSDYLLGLTQFRAADIEIHRICEKTGLQETVIQRFIDNNKEDCEFIAHWWSFILSQPLFYRIPSDLSIADQDLQKQNRYKSIFSTIEWQMKHYPENEPNVFLQLRDEYQYYNDLLTGIIPAFQGMLYKISREFTDTVEKHITETHQPELERMTEQNIQYAQKMTKEGIYYMPIHED